MSVKLKLLTLSEQKDLIQKVRSSKKYHLIVLILLDTGLRVTELVTMRISSFDLHSDSIKIRSLKKRGKEDFREIPITDRVRDQFIIYYQSLKNKDKDAFLFPSYVDRGHIDRRRVYRKIKLETNNRYSPHDLRHTFASRVVNEGATVRIAQSLLGHKSQRTTEIYLHVDEDEKRAAIKKIQKITIYEKIKKAMFRNTSTYNIIHTTDFTHDCSIGRSIELRQLYEFKEKKINVVLIGPQGIGKSHLLGLIQGDDILRLDDLKLIKKTLSNMIDYLKRGAKKDVYQLMYDGREVDQLMTKTSIPEAVRILISLCDQNEFTIIIDDLTDITLSSVRVLEQLKNHFHIIAASRQIKISHQSMISNFQKLEIKPLNRIESNSLIDKCSDSYYKRIKDYSTFRNHVYEQTQGNPLFLIELLERFSKEKIIDVSSIREVRHTAALKDIDLSLFIVIVLSSMMLLRYIGGETDDSAGAFRLLGGVFMLFALFARPLLNMTKKRFI